MKIKLLTAVLCMSLSAFSLGARAADIGPPAMAPGGAAESSDVQKSDNNVAVDDGGNLQLVPESELSKKSAGPPVLPPPAMPPAVLPADSTSVAGPGSSGQDGTQNSPPSEMKSQPGRDSPPDAKMLEGTMIYNKQQ